MSNIIWKTKNYNTKPYKKKWINLKVEVKINNQQFITKIYLNILIKTKMIKTNVI